jgi:hypothetical protein
MPAAQASYAEPVNRHLNKEMLSHGQAPVFVLYPQKLWTTLWSIKKPRAPCSEKHCAALLWSKNNQAFLPWINNDLAVLLGIALPLQAHIPPGAAGLSGHCE